MAATDQIQASEDEYQRMLDEMHASEEAVEHAQVRKSMKEKRGQRWG